MVAPGAEWLAVSPGAGTVASGGSTTISLLASGLEPGHYEGSVTVSSADAGGFTIAVSYDAE
jgi:hypothetical protein